MATPPSSLLGDAREIAGVVDVLRGIGLAVMEGDVADGCLLAGMTVRDDMLVYDRGRPGHVGDLLHEAGHLAVAAPAERCGLPQVGSDPAEEMAAIAWSYAAATAIGVPIGRLFHAAYKAGPDYPIRAFSDGTHIGLPMLRHWCMAADEAGGGRAFPAMLLWLRPA